MPRLTHIDHIFVENIPRQLEDGVLYISMPFATAMHKCCCGCGYPVVTPFSPTDWKMTFDGETISLHPSIGNWGFDCKSHYWIQNSHVQWAGKWSKEQIQTARIHEQFEKDRYFENRKDTSASVAPEQSAIPVTDKPKASLWARLMQWIKGWRK